MRKTNSTLVPMGRSSSKASGKRKITFCFALFFLFALVANQLNAQCSISCNNVNISVGQQCEADVHWSTLATLPSSCNMNPADTNFTIIVKELDGTFIAESNTGNIVVDLHNYLNDSVTWEVYYDDGTNSNLCWTNTLVEDKMPPMVNCSNDTIVCLEMFDEPFPPASDNCTAEEDLEMIVRSRHYVPVCSEDILKLMIREYQVRDESGNLSQMCSDTVWFRRISLDSNDINMPPNYTNDTSLLCQGVWDSDGDGYPDPNETGVPTYTINGITYDLYPQQVDACNLQFDYTDREFNIPCGRKIMRTWSGMEWCAGSDQFIDFVQVINIIDTVPPEVEATVDEINKSTNLFSCEANVLIPQANVTDNCNDITNYEVSTNAPGVPLERRSHPQTVSMMLPIGTWQVYIKAYDECNQNDAGVDSITVNVIDNTPPVAVCDQHTTVSLTSDGTARIYAPTFDDGSHDECGPIESMQVRRMSEECDGTFDHFGPYVEFCCEDIRNNPIMIVFRVEDQSGNLNTCMVEVEVQDKLPAIIEAPDDISVTCEFNFDPSNLSQYFGDVEIVADLHELDDPQTDPRDSIFIDDPGDLTNGPVFKTIDGFAYDNCDVTISTDSTIDINSCGTGIIVRRFYAVGAGNSTQAVDSQIIIIYDQNPFDENSIDWPDDAVLTNDCNINGELTPDYLVSEGYEGYPEYLDDECTQLARSYEDWYFPVDDPNDPACFKILRRWKVIDWCTYDDGKRGQPWEHTQVIKVMNNNAPTFDLPCEDVTLISIQGDCSDRFVTLTQEATDDCTAKEDLMYSYRIDAFNDGDFDIEGFTNDASDEYPVGTHLIEWSVEDRCGNRNTCSYLFTIEDKKGPSPICRNLTVELMAVDTDDDGSPDDGMLDIWASDFNHKSYHACAGIEITAISFSADPLDTGRTLTCDSIGTAVFEIWVHASNGTAAYCRTYAIVQANNGACGPGNEGPTFPIAGNITNPVSNKAMQNVEVVLEGSSAMAETNDQGDYDFNPMPEGGSYTVAPKKDYDLLNGVSTFDILLIQQHILGLKNLETPYKLIAADVNNDKRITGSDMIALRKAILGIEDEFPNNMSWRFIDNGFQFQTSDPLQEAFPESYEIKSLGAPMTNVNFDALKIGDINGSVDRNVDGRSAESLDFIAEDVQFEAGQLVRIPVTSDNFQDIQGYQFTLNYNDVLSFAGLESGALNVSESNIGNLAEQSALTMSWNDIEGVDVEKGDVLFTLVFEANNNGRLSSAVGISDAITKAEAYANNDVMSTALSFRTSAEEEASFVLYQNTPNPFASQTMISFELPERAEATLKVFDVTGKELMVVNNTFEKGYNQVELSRDELNATGVLYYRIESGDYSATKKMILLD